MAGLLALRKRGRITIGANRFGRIGRCGLPAVQGRGNARVMAIGEPIAPEGGTIARVPARSGNGLGVSNRMLDADACEARP